MGDTAGHEVAGVAVDDNIKVIVACEKLRIYNAKLLTGSYRFWGCESLQAS